MDPASLVVAGIVFVAAEVSRKAGDEAVDFIWSRIRDAWGKAFGRDPAPGEVRPEAVASLVDANPALDAEVTRFWDESPVLRRARHAERALRGARVLWVDDHPEGNILERDSLEAFGLTVRTAESTRSATACLEREQFDFVISDIAREGNATEGLDALPLLRRAAPGIPVVLYVLRLENSGTPAGAFGITNRPSDLLHLCIDVVERRRI